MTRKCEFIINYDSQITETRDLRNKNRVYIVGSDVRLVGITYGQNRTFGKRNGKLP